MSQEIKRCLVVRITGSDRPGILAAALRAARSKGLYVSKVRGYEDFGQATVNMRLICNANQLEAAKKCMCNEFDSLAPREKGKLSVSFTEIHEPDSAESQADMYPLPLWIEATVPDRTTPDFFGELTEKLAEKGVNIVMADSDAFEPAGAPRHALACRHILGVHIPITLFAGLESFEKELNTRLQKWGCHNLKITTVQPV